LASKKIPPEVETMVKSVYNDFVPEYGQPKDIQRVLGLYQYCQPPNPGTWTDALAESCTCTSRILASLA